MSDTLVPASRKSVPQSIKSLFECGHYALIVGIDEYGEGIGRLSGAASDARAVATVLRDPARKDRFDPVTLLTNAEATREGIKRAFRELRALVASNPRARVLLYFAGHGIAATSPEEAGVDTPGYFIPQDARRGEVDSYLSMAEVRRAIDGLGCHHLLLVLDCCFAGAFRWCTTRAGIPSPRRLYEERVRRYLRDPAWHVITSAAHDEKALDTLGGKVLLAGRRDAQPPEDVHGARSPFAVGLVKALRGDADFTLRAATGPDGVITGSEIHLYIEGLFATWEGGGARRFQRPLFFHWPTRADNKGEFVFLNPAAELRLERAVDLVEANNPYRGLSPHTHDPARPALFFGRDALTRDLVAKVESERIVVVLGSSGAGKSSLVCAGALPALARDGWLPLPVVRPREDPAQALRALAVALDADAPSGERLADTVARYVARHPGAQHIAVIDQLEELVTLRRGGDTKAALLDEVDAAVRASAGALRVVYTLRSDFEPHFARELVERYPAGRFRVTPMGRDDLRAVIEGPAEACVFCFDPPALVEEMVREVVDAPGALPLLSFALSEMYLGYARAFGEGTRDDRALTRADYVALGGVEGSLARQAERVHEALDEATRSAMRRVMLRMVSLEGGQPARRRVLDSELVFADEAETGRARVVLDALTAARLVVRGEHEGEAYAEPAHDRIVIGWPRLRSWIDEPAEKRRSEAVSVLRDWMRNQQGTLDRDPRLDAWRGLLEGSDNPFNREEGELLRRSVAARRDALEQAEAQVRTLQAALTRARDQSLVSVAREATSDPTLQAALLREVEHPEHVLRWQDLAREVLRRPDVALAVFEHGDCVRSARFAGDGLRVVTASDDHTARVWGADGAGEPVVLRGHEGPVVSAAFSADGTRVVTASDDGTARVWKADGTAEPVVLRGHETWLTSAAFSADGTRVVTASGDSTARVWRADGTGEAVVLRGHGGALFSAVFSPDGASVVTTSSDATARVWRADGAGEPVVLRGQDDAVESAVFSPDGTLVAAVSVDMTARVWRADGTGEPVVLLGHEGAVLSAAFSPDGERLVTASDDGTARVWNADGTGDPVVLQGHELPVVSAAFSADGARVVTASLDTTARVWSADGTAEPIVLRGHGSELRSAAFSPDGLRVITASDDHAARVWRADGMVEPVVLRGHENPMHSADLSLDGTRVVTASDDGTARVWRADGTGEPAILQGEEVEVLSARFSLDGAFVVTASSDRAARVWRADGEGDPVVLQGHEDTVNSVGFSPDGGRVVTASDDGTARVWQSDGAGEPVILRGHEGPVVSAAFSADGAFVVTASNDATARVWRADGAGEPVVLQGHEASLASARFSPDGTQVVTASNDTTARVWRADGAGESVILRGHENSLNAAAFSPDGVHVASASGDSTARVWRADGTGEPVVLRGHEYQLHSVVFSPDGARVVTASDDSTARVWRADGTGDPVVLRGHEDSVLSAVFSPDGARVLTASDDRTARVWWSHPLPEVLWGATSYCVPIQKRITLLGETEPEATEAYDKARQKVATLAAARRAG